jgi:hypothetical protein
MTTLASPNLAETPALVRPGPTRIARAVAFGVMIVPLIVLCGINTESPFDQIAFAVQIGVTLILFHAGAAPRTRWVARLECVALALMLFVNLRLWLAGPEPQIGFGNAMLYGPLLVAAGVATLGTLALLVAQERRARP